MYRNQLEALESLPPEQFKDAVLAIRDYAMDDIEPNGDPVIVAIWKMCKPIIDKNNKNYENGKRRYCDDDSESQRLHSDSQRIHSESQRIEANPQQVTAVAQPNVKGEMLNTKESTPNGVRKKSAPRFSPPTVEEVREYASEKGYTGIDADRFVDFYASKGWMVGKNPMKDWKAAVRNWNRSQREGSPNSLRQESTAKRTRFVNYEQRTVDYDKMIMEGDYR